MDFLFALRSRDIKKPFGSRICSVGLAFVLRNAVFFNLKKLEKSEDKGDLTFNSTHLFVV